MEMPVEWRESSNGQLISINRKDSTRLLEVYVKRSLSLSEGFRSPESPGGPEQRKSKWVMARPRRMRRHSSDPSLHHSPSAKDEDEDRGMGASLTPHPPPPTAPPADPFPFQPPVKFRMHDEEAAKEKVKDIVEEKEVKPEVSVSKTRRKPSLWKSFLGLFSKKLEEEEKEVEEIPRGVAVGEVFPSQEELSDISATCLPLAPGMGQQKRSKKRRRSKRYRSFRKSFRKNSPKDITAVEAIVSVHSYFEKVSEEMELIVNQVKHKESKKVLTDEEVINRIIALTIKEGDAIDEKLKENPTLSNFFQGMSYSAFQMLADTYLKETAPVQNQAPPSLPQAAPELVKLAFTLDFTARVAGLSRQNVGHITGLGNRYLAERFEYTQACTDHPWSDTDND